MSKFEEVMTHSIICLVKYLNCDDYDGKKQKEISILEQTIAYKKEQYAKTYVNKNKQLKGVRDHSIKLANENENLDDELSQKNVSLYERKLVENEMSEFRTFSYDWQFECFKEKYV